MTGKTRLHQTSGRMRQAIAGLRHTARAENLIPILRLQFGWPGLLAVVVAALATWHYLVTLPALSRDLEVAVNAVQAARVDGTIATPNPPREALPTLAPTAPAAATDTNEMTTPKVTLPGPSSSLRDRVDAIYAYLDPLDRSVEDDLAKLYAIALQMGVTMRTADYRLEPLRDTAVRVYSVRLPLESTYAQTRAFVENALKELPHLALDRISFKRKQANQIEVEASLELSLFMATSSATDATGRATRLTNASGSP